MQCFGIYKKDMVVCYGLNEFGNYLICRISFIIIPVHFKCLHFVGKSITIMYNADNGLYYETDTTNTTDRNVIFINFTSLLTHESLLQHKDSYNSITYCFKSSLFEKF